MSLFVRFIVTCNIVLYYDYDVFLIFIDVSVICGYYYNGVRGKESCFILFPAHVVTLSRFAHFHKKPIHL